MVAAPRRPLRSLPSSVTGPGTRVPSWKEGGLCARGTAVAVVVAGVVALIVPQNGSAQVDTISRAIVNFGGARPGARGPSPVGPADVESEPSGDFAGWVRQVNAAVAEAERGRLRQLVLVLVGVHQRRGTRGPGEPPRPEPDVGDQAPRLRPGRGRQSGVAGAARAHRGGPAARQRRLRLDRAAAAEQQRRAGEPTRSAHKPQQRRQIRFAK